MACLDRDPRHDTTPTLIPRLPETTGCLHDPALPAEPDAREDHRPGMAGLVEASGDRRELLRQCDDLRQIGALHGGLEVELSASR